MAHKLSKRARKVAWNVYDDKCVNIVPQIRRIDTDSTDSTDGTVNSDDSIDVSTSIQRLSTSTSIDQFVSVLRRDGCVIVDNFTDVRTLQNASREVTPWLKSRDGKDVTNLTPLIKQSPAIRNIFFANTLYQKLCEEFLTVEVARWKHDRLTTDVCRPLLSSVNVRKLQGRQTQNKPLRHDMAMGAKREQVCKYEQGRDSMLGLILPSNETIHLHAALGSHLYGSDPECAIMAIEEELKVGQALIVLGSLYHHVAAAAGRRTKSEPALMHSIWSCAGTYRPEEHVASQISAVELASYPQVVRERLRQHG